jgi:AcrR family transcriptional regulator
MDSMSKGEQTKALVLNQGLVLASEVGLKSISIGVIANASGLSRSGVTRYFKDIEDMQMSILQYAEDLFIAQVLKKSYCVDPMENLNNLYRNWLNWMLPLSNGELTSCPFIKATIQYQNQSQCLIKRFMAHQQQKLLSYLSETAKRCIECKYFLPTANCEQFAYEFYCIYVGHNILNVLNEADESNEHYYSAIEQLILRYKI